MYLVKSFRKLSRMLTKKSKIELLRKNNNSRNSKYNSRQNRKMRVGRIINKKRKMMKMRMKKK